MNHQEEEFEKSDVVITQDNVRFILMDGYEYCFNRMLGDAQKWKCSNTSCYAYFKILSNQILPGVMAHTHPRDDGVRSQGTSCNEVRNSASPERGVHSPVMQRTEPPGLKRTYPKAKNGQFRSLRELPHASSSVAKKDKSSRAVASKVKLPSGKTVERRSPLHFVASPPDSGFVSDQDPSSFAALIFATASPTESMPCAKRPKLSEIGPPPTPPLSQNSDQSSPLPPVIDLVEVKYQPPSFSPDLDVHFMRQPSNSQISPNNPERQPDTFLKHKDNPEIHAAKPSTSSTPHSNRSRVTYLEKPSKFAKYKEYEDAMLHLNNETFGYAVTSLLSDLPSKTAEDIRYEIATLLYDAVEGNIN